MLLFWGSWTWFLLKKFSSSKKTPKPSAWKNEMSGIDGAADNKGGSERRCYSPWQLMRHGRLREIDAVNKMFWKTAAKVANQPESEQAALSSARRVLTPVLRKRRVWAGARAESRLCRRPRDEPGLLTVWRSVSGIPADLACMKKEKMGNQCASLSPLWRRPSTCGCHSQVFC